MTTSGCTTGLQGEKQSYGESNLILCPARKGSLTLLTMLCLQVFIHYPSVRTSLLKPSCFMGLSDSSQESEGGNGANKCNLQVKLTEAI